MSSVVRGWSRHELRRRLRPWWRYVVAAAVIIVADLAVSAAPIVAQLVEAVTDRLKPAETAAPPPQPAPQTRTAAATRKASGADAASEPREDGALVFVETAEDHLPPPPFSATERTCLARAVYFEGRGEPIEGQIAIAQVVMNRMRSGRWPGTICGVVYQGVERGEKCQFSFACYDDRKPLDGTAWQQSKWIADDVAAGRAFLSELDGAYYFHTLAVKPVWRLSMQPVRTIGQHVFYVERGRPEAAPAVAAAAPAAPPPPATLDRPAAAVTPPPAPPSRMSRLPSAEARIAKPAREPRKAPRSTSDFSSEMMERMKSSTN